MDNSPLKNYGHFISDNEGELRDISGIIEELETVRDNLSTHAMSDHVLFLKGRKEMLIEVIDYLKYIIK